MYIYFPSFLTTELRPALPRTHMTLMDACKPTAAQEHTLDGPRRVPQRDVSAGAIGRVLFRVLPSVALVHDAAF